MRRTQAALLELKDALEKLKQARPNDLDTPPAGYEGIDYQFFDEVFSGLEEKLAAISTAASIDSRETLLFDLAFAKSLGQLVPLVNDAKANGAPWLLTAAYFPEKLADTSQRITALAARNARILSGIARSLAKRGVSETLKVVDAAPIADELNSLLEQAKESVAELEQAGAEIEGLQESANKSVSTFQTLKSEIDSAHSHATESKADSERLHSEIQSFWNKSESIANSLDLKLDELRARVKSSEKLVSEAIESLSETRKNVKRQGLAGGFTQRAARISKERRSWVLVLIGAALVLTALSIVLAIELDTFTYEHFAVALLRRLAIAAPSIWLGWYAARQVGRLNRIQEDYEYKAATALAFESYRDEVASASDATLLNQLLVTAIKNFGDNPVRLNDHHEKDPNSPLEELLKKIERDGTLTLLDKFQKLFGAKR